MRLTREMGSAILRVVVVTAVAAAGVALSAFAQAPRTGSGNKGAPTEVAQPAPLAPVARGTRGNLQDAFQNETNTKARYVNAAAIADREGYPYVARLFRACAQSEQVHADQDVHAIAWMGDEAKAFMQREYLNDTPTNLQAAIERENYEANEWDPALIRRARAEHLPPAVRSFTYAMLSEREHAKLLSQALAELDRKPPSRPFYVCSVCGMTVTAVSFKQCPTCFASAKKYQAVD